MAADPGAADPGAAQEGTPEGAAAAVRTALAGFLAEKRAALGTMAPELLPVADELAELCRCAAGPGGRLPAASTAGLTAGLTAELVGGWQAGGGGGPAGVVVQVATALELLRVADLAHREVMAAAGTPGVQVPARERGPRAGDRVVLGADAGILVGDLALVWSEELLGRAGLGPEALARVTPVWDRMRTALLTGRYLELVAGAGGAPRGAAVTADGWARELGTALADGPPD